MVKTDTKTIPLSNYLTKVSQLAYGCMGLGGGWNNNSVSQDDIKQANLVVDTALEAGINIFDHADIYAFGKAEIAFGEVLNSRPELRKEIFIQSKCGIRFADEKGPKRYDFSSKWIINSVDNILKRLRTEYIDVLMLHRPDPLMVLDEVANTLAMLKDSGKVRFFGTSNMHQHQIAYLQSALNFPLIANQVEISLANRYWLEEGILAGASNENSGNFTAGTLEYCQQNNIQIQAWGALAQGIYSGKYIGDADEITKSTAELVSNIANRHQTSPEAIVLAWLMRHPAKIQPVLGTTNLDRLNACALAQNVKLTREEWYQIFESARGAELP